MRIRRFTALALVALLVVAAGCGDDSDGGDDSSSDTTVAADDSGDESADTAETEATTAEDGEMDESEASDTGSAGGGSATVTLDGEEISVSSARCFLEEQEAAAGGGSIEMVAQAFGTNAAGDDVSLDFSRFSEDSQFAGDDVSITVGDPFSEDSVSLSGNEPTGAVSLDGNVLSATDFPLVGSDFEESTVSFEISC